MKKKLSNTDFSAGHRIVNFAPLMFFLLSLLLSVITTYHATGNFLDSDASSELVLAQHLSQTGQILSDDWFYSTELRVVNTQLIYAPLFLLFSDWHMIRFVGALLLQGIYILSYAFLLKQAGMEKRCFFASAAILLLPIGVAYGRIVLYHCFYIPHIALSFLIVGLFLRIVKNGLRDIPSLSLLILVSFLGGLGGIRQLMITHAPMLLGLVLICFREDAAEQDNGKAALLASNRFPLLLVAGLAAGASFIGLKINGTYLKQYYNFATFDAISLKPIGLSELGNILYGFFHQFGYRKDQAVMSVMGIFSLGGIVSACYIVYVSIRKLISHTKETDIRTTLLETFLLWYSGVMIAVFLLTGEYGYTQYLSLCISWGAIVLVNAFAEIPKNIHPLNLRRLFSWLSVVLLLANGGINTGYYNGIECFEQPYEGLNYHVDNKKEEIGDVAQFLTENGYDIGYATFWEGNILTEMSNGAIRVNNIYFHEQTGNISYYNWLCFWHLRQETAKKPFLILSWQEKPLFEAHLAFDFCNIVFEDGIHFVYEITNVEQFKGMLCEW